MIARIAGTLEQIDGLVGLIRPQNGGLTYEVMLPGYLAAELAERVGSVITLDTLAYLDSPNQGVSFVPRLIGFGSRQDRRFFELFTTVRGLGMRKALKAMAREPALIARAISQRDAVALVQLPEIGKRLAETILVELSGKVGAFLTDGEAMELEAKSLGSLSGLPPMAEDAIAALTQLGETRTDAERLVRMAIGKDPSLETADAVVGAAFGCRS